jgi:uncharacterized phage protein gp47/JayE
MSFGIDASGFTPKPNEDIKTDLESGFRAVFGAAITTIAQSVFGTLIAIIADRLADLWQLGLALYNASFREGAVGVQLDNIGALTGTTRKAATYTKVNLTCAGTNGTVITAGSICSIPSVGTKFTNDAPGTISGGAVVIEFHAVDTGPKQALAGTVTAIDTPITGWASVTNAADHFQQGTDRETDAAYRVRQIRELRAQGAATGAAILAKVAAVTNVSDSFIFENVSDITDANGLPPHSFEVVADGGTDLAVAQAIADTKPQGIATYGTTTQAAVDANGFAVDINFSRPEELDIYIIINQTVDSSKYPSNGDTLVKAAVAEYGDLNYHIGSEVRSSALVPSIFGATAGVLECALPLIGIAPSPVASTTINANNRQRAALDTSRITVNTTYTIPV